MSERFDHVLDSVDDYVHDALEPAARDYVERHCERCPICKTALDEAHKRLAALRALPPSEASEDLIAATLKAIPREDGDMVMSAKRSRWWRPGRLAVAAAVLLVVGVHVYYWTLNPSPYDLRIFGQSSLMAGTPGSLRVWVVDDKLG